MKKTLLGFSLLGLISLLFCLKPTSANAVSDFVVSSASICYDSRIPYDYPYELPGARCYDGNWRFNTSVKNIGDSSNANEPGVVNPNYSYGYHIIDSSVIHYMDYNIILASGASRDFCHTISGVACEYFLISAVGSELDPPYPSWDGKKIDIDSVGPCFAVPTPTPTPTSPPVCPLKLSSETGSLKYTFNNEWKYYVSFTPSVAGKVDKVSVKAGNWGNALRSVTCKVTNNSGQNVSIEKSSAAFISSSGAQWRDISFKTNPFNLQANTQYKLYCKGPDSWGSLYWIYSTQNNPESRTYRIYQCQN